jgi:hypothetical protein
MSTSNCVDPERLRPILRPVIALLLSVAIPANAHDRVNPQSVSETARPHHEAVRVQSGRLVLAATLVLPAGEQPHPAVVLASGAQDGVYAPSHLLVQRLAHDGIAVLVLGKRGVVNRRAPGGARASSNVPTTWSVHSSWSGGGRRSTPTRRWPRR